MFTCTVCNGTDYTKECGRFYCVDCHTQVEGWREEDTEYADMMGTAIRQKSTRTKSLQNIKADKNKLEWTTWQLYNHILVIQVGELENLPGVAHGFRYIVLTLWTRYLHCKGYAFLDKALPDQKKASCKRDLAALSNIHITAMFRKKTKKRIRRRMSSEADDSTSEMASTILSDSNQQTESEEKKTTEYQPRKNVGSKRSMYKRMLEDQMSGISDDLWDSESHTTFETDSLSFSISSGIQSPSTASEALSDDFKARIFHPALNRRTLLTILYLGLLISNSEAQLVDLLRWMRAGEVSFVELLHLLPEDVKVLQDDVIMFGALPLMPKATAIYELALHHCVSIGVPQVPFPDTADLAQRFVKELHLPDVLCSQVKKLIAQHPPKYNNFLKLYKKLPSFEYIAMAYVIVLLKLLFGLDDVEEVCWSEVAQNINQKAGKQIAFEWEQWVEWIEYRNLMLSEHVISTKATVYHQHKELEVDVKHVYNCGVDDFSQRNLRRQLSKLDEGIEEISTSAKVKIPPSLFYLHDAVQKLKQLKNRTSILDNDFSNTNVDYVINCFNDGSCHKRDTQCFRNIENVKLIFISKPDVRVSLIKKSRFMEKQGVSLRVAKLQANIAGRKSYWFLPTNARHKAIDFETVKSKLPLSFQWLLEQCAIVLGENETCTLYDEVCKIEVLTMQHIDI